MQQKEFEVEIDKGRVLKCRPKQMTASEFLGLDTIFNREDADKAAYMYQQIMERIEVEVLGTWQPLKQKGAEVYCPDDLKDRPGKLYQICTLFLTKVFFPVFLESKESNK